jgi:hypothetical protein
MVKIARGEVKDVTVIDSRTEKEHKGDDIRALRPNRLDTDNFSCHMGAHSVEPSGSGKSEKRRPKYCMRIRVIFGAVRNARWTVNFCAEEK